MNDALDKEASDYRKSSKEALAVHKTLKSISWYKQIDEK